MLKLRRFQNYFIVFDRCLDALACLYAAVEQLFGGCILNEALDGAAKRSGPVGLVVAYLFKLVNCLLADLKLNVKR